MVLDRHAAIKYGDTMISTIKNGYDCLPMPASARCCQTEMRISYWICEVLRLDACRCQPAQDLAYSHSNVKWNCLYGCTYPSLEGLSNKLCRCIAIRLNKLPNPPGQALVACG